MYKTLSVGEVLWDLFPDYKKPGGSPANVAYHLHILGCQSLLLSSVGDDKNGAELLQFLQDKGIPTRYIQRNSSLPTGLVTVEFEEGEPSYTIHEPAAWDAMTISSELEKELKTLDAICFASLAQRYETSAATIKTLLETVDTGCLKVFDLNLRPPFIERELIEESINLADVIKINEHEYKTLSDWFGSDQFAEALVTKNPSKTDIFL